MIDYHESSNNYRLYCIDAGAISTVLLQCMKNILITGANKGIGFETALQLAKQGYFVYLGSRNRQNGEEAAEKIKAQGIDSIEAIEIDIADINSVKQARQILESKIDALDFLINNAGIAGDEHQDFTSGSVDNLRRIFDTNFFGTVQTTQQFLPLLRKSAQPFIINVSSEVGSIALRTEPGRNRNRDKYNSYGASKTALNAFTVMLANELLDAGISVNSVTPGYTATDLNQFQGAKTVAEGALPIVRLVTEANKNLTAKFFKDGGEVAW